MSLLRALQWLILIAFVLEVVNPTTSFVREHAKAGKQIQQKAEAPPSLDSTDLDDESDDFLAASAILPAVALPTHPNFTKQKLSLSAHRPLQAEMASIQKPPKLS